MNASAGACTAAMPYGYQPQFKGIYIATELLVAVMAIIGNLLVCLAVTHNKKLRTVTNYFLVSLAVADILVGLVAIPCAVLTNLGEPRHNLPLCLVLLSFLLVLTQSSILSMLAVAAERYMAILLPFQYQRVMSPRNARLALLVTWGLAAITGSVPFMDPQRQPPDSDYCIFTCVVDMNYLVYFNFFCCFLMPLVAMFMIYSHIFITVRHQIRRIAVVRGTAEDITVGSGCTGAEDTGSSAAGGTTGGRADVETRTCKARAKAREETEPGIGSLIKTETTTVTTTVRITIAGSSSSCAPADPRPGESTKSKSNTRICQELRKATSLFLVLFLFMVCWMPIHVINCILLLAPQNEVPMSLTLAAILLSHVNSALNPILYAYRMRSFRHTLTGMWRGMWSMWPRRQ
ncbi:adenosine receptor A1-like [Larimichthys crocea]|uniref:adenosine receptor A1-like n=1 Tax=Larimichthys crocea TaxID=215358 RepID=UPI000F5D7137|nr:adenosine receptor A1-like [Larimichthys crocea]XP_027147569.1 adenosine receptor A1-like [Larimichthys crocea]XP_027147570.1 adenosine receptor A1-like [Larimichthys crocea]